MSNRRIGTQTLLIILLCGTLYNEWFIQQLIQNLFAKAQFTLTQEAITTLIDFPDLLQSLTQITSQQFSTL